MLFLLSLKQRRVSVTTRLSKILSASSILEVLKVSFFLIFSSLFPPIDVYFHMFQVLLRQIVVNLTENAIRKPPQTVPSLPYLQWNMFLFSKVEKVRQNEEKLKHHCAKFIFSPLIVFFFLVISHCSFFTS